MTMTEMMSTRWPMTISKTESSQMPMPAKKEAVCESLTHWKAACSWSQMSSALVSQRITVPSMHSTNMMTHETTCRTSTSRGEHCRFSQMTSCGSGAGCTVRPPPRMRR